MGQCAGKEMGSGNSQPQRGSTASRFAERISDNTPASHNSRPIQPNRNSASQLQNRNNRNLANSKHDKDAVRTYPRLTNPANVIKDSISLKEGFVSFRMQANGSGEWRVELDPDNFDAEPRSPPNAERQESAAFDVYSAQPQFGSFIAGQQEIKVPNALAKLISGSGVIQITVWPNDPGGDILSEKTIVNVQDGKIAVAPNSEKKSPSIQRLAVKLEDGDVVNVEVQPVYRGDTPGESNDESECVICLSRSCTVTILPCGHMCLCKKCAGITSSSWAHQCPVCRGRSLVKATDTLFDMLAENSGDS